MGKKLKYMTVGELIEQLQKYEKDKYVGITYNKRENNKIMAIVEDDVCVSLVTKNGWETR